MQVKTETYMIANTTFTFQYINEKFDQKAYRIEHKTDYDY